ncbi:MAG TPA: ribonuclease P protein component [Geminicoccus sp.]|uniref:ribonuclease P protein component n=1 Tax=Geminicoccus sp. TaxID=2024832 RepID=UPI002BAAA756|nr:ribonuclease P protein component [Geminicoccus sp.]HWL67352.1 ribonuclease P protein component [Geminicoccus sp.]
MAATEVLKKRPDFLRVAKGRRWHGSGMVVQYAARVVPDERTGVGFTASRKVGGAVVRNRAKRRLRAVVRELVPAAAPAGLDLVLIARPQTATLPYAVLREDLTQALAKIRAGTSGNTRR